MNNQIKQYFDKIVGNGRDRSLQRTGFRFTIGALAALATVGIFAVAVDTMTTFTTGTAAKASEVNTNFTALKTAVESIPSWVKGTTATNAVYTAGNVGIGTTTPSVKLDTNTVATSNTTTEVARFGVSIAGNTSTTALIPLLTLSGQLPLGANNQSAAISMGGIGAIFEGASGNVGTSLAFYNRQTNTSLTDSFSEKMRITSAGNVGIGTTSPTDKVTVVDGKIKVGVSNSTEKFTEIVTSGVELSSDVATAVDFKNLSTEDYDFRIVNFSGSTLDFVSAASSLGNPSISIATNGNVGFNTRSPSTLLHVAGNACTTGTGMTACASDKRLKENVQPITNALSTILQLNPVSFNWNKTSEKEFGYKTGQKDIGVIAQEIEKINPEWVRTTQGDYKAVNDTFVKWYSVKAIQELALRLRSTTDQVTKLSDALAEEKSENAKLREELRATAKAMSLASLRTTLLEERLKAIENWQMAKK